MLSAKTEKNKRVIACDVEKDQDYFCPICTESVVLKKGKIMVHHFAHVSGSSCDHIGGESKVHMQCKESIYKAFKLRKKIKKLDLEHFIGDYIADVYCKYKGKKLAIEIQMSPKTDEDIRKKTKAYSVAGVYTLWMCPEFPEEKYDSDGSAYYSIKSFQRSMMDIHCGNSKKEGILFVWSKEDSSILKCKFKRIKIYSEYLERYVYQPYTFELISHEEVKLKELVFFETHLHRHKVVR